MARDTRSKKKKKYFTVAEANATLPLVRVIVKDLAELANDLRARYERLVSAQPGKGRRSDLHQEELQQAQDEFDRDQDRLRDYEQELMDLGVHLKDYQAGLIDFPCWLDDREVYLCWRLGEPEVAFWHEIDAGFAGRRKLVANPALR